MTPEEFFALACDYVRADGWEQDADGWWIHDQDAPSGCRLTTAISTALRHDGIAQNAPAPPVSTTFGPSHPEGASR